MKRRLVATILLCIGAFVVSGGSVMPPTQPDTAHGIQITAVNGVEIQRSKLTKAGGLTVLPGVISSSGEYVDEALEVQSVEKGLPDPSALSGWVLCEAELRAEASILRGYARAMRDFPQNRPLHYADAQGNLTPEDAVRARELENRAMLYDKAAQAAKKAHVPCVDPKRAVNAGNYVRFTDPRDSRQSVDIPDYSVVELPVEFFLAQGDCADDIERSLKEVQATPVDTVPGKRGGLDTFTERGKASGEARLKAQLAMLVSTGVTC